MDKNGIYTGKKANECREIALKLLDYMTYCFLNLGGHIFFDKIHCIL
jgi:hypothetical protein